ncbi:MAG: DUF6452 family protein [Bacteroidota bacterium]
MKHWFKILAIFNLGLILNCGDVPTCIPTESNLVKIAFLDDEGKSKPLTFTLRALDREDLFLDYTDTTLSKLVLPLNGSSNTTTFVIDHDAISDTLGLSYDVVAQLISPECGLEIALSELDTTSTTFENLRILENIIHEDVNTNIEITL